MKRIIAGFGLIWSVYTLFMHFILVPPGPGAPPQDILRYLHYNFNALTITTFWGIVVALLFLIFASCAMAAVHSSGQAGNQMLHTVASGGLYAYVILALASNAILLSVSYYLPQAQSPVLVLAGYQVFWTIDPAIITLLSLTVLGSAIAVIGLRNRTLPNLLSWSGLALGILTLISTLFVLWSPLAVLVPLAEIFLPIWFAALAIWMMAIPKTREDAESEAPPMPSSLETADLPVD